MTSKRTQILDMADQAYQQAAEFGFGIGRDEHGLPTITHLPGEGHNAAATDDRLRLLIERIERLEEEKRCIAEDVRDVFSEAKAVGYDPKIMRQVLRLRRMKPDDRKEMEAVLEVYKCAVGLG